MLKLRLAVGSLAGIALMSSAMFVAAQESATPETAKVTITPPKEVAERGEMLFCTSLVNPPGETTAADGQTPEGISIDVMNQLTSMMGVKTKVVNLSSQSLLPALDAGKCDAAMGGLGRTPVRAERYGLVDYWQVPSGFMVQKGNPLKLKALEDLAGLRVSVKLGGRNFSLLSDMSDLLVKQGAKPIDVRPMASNVVSFHNLQLGRVDSMVADALVIYYFAAQDEKFEVAATPIPPSNWSIFMRKANTDLVSAVQKGIDSMATGGQMRAILAKYGIKEGIEICGGGNTCQGGLVQEVRQ
jgi:polar amino acid transport system substrate-binding protein